MSEFSWKHSVCILVLQDRRDSVGVVVEGCQPFSETLPSE